MSRITRLVALILTAILFLAMPALADSEKKDKKDKDQGASEEPASTEEPAPPEQTTVEPDQQGSRDGELGDLFHLGGGGCEPVGVQLTPPPPTLGIDDSCLPVGTHLDSYLEDLRDSLR